MSLREKNISHHKNHFSKKETIAVFILFGMLWIYLFLRGAYLPIMHDEIGTFYFYIQSGVVFPPNAHYDANNHVLNSLLSHWSYLAFGSSPLALRLPNILLYALFFFSLKNIASRIEHLLFRWGFLLSVSMSYFIFEYFSETRGYGISLAFLMVAIFQYIKMTENGKILHIFLAGVFLWLSTCANLTSMVTSIILFMLMGVYSILIDWKTSKIRLLYKIGVLILTGLPFLILVQWSLKLKELGLLYYGTLDGFYALTVKSLFEVFVGDYHPWMAVLVTLLFLAVVAFLIIQFIKEKSLKNLLSGYNIMPLLIIGSVVVINLLAWIMEVNYPEDRTGIYLFVFMAGATAFVFSKWALQKKWLSFVAIIYLFFPISFVAKPDLRHASFWRDARASQPIYDQVTTLESNFKFPLVVGGYATQELCWYYLNHQDEGEQGRLHWTVHPTLDTDVQFICPVRMTEPKVREYYDSMYYDKAANLVYWKRKNFLEKTLIKTQDVVPVEKTTIDYYTLMKVPADSLINKTVYMGVEMTLDAEAAPFRSRLVVACDRAEGDPTNLAYEFIQLDWIRKSWKGEENNVLQGSLVHNVPEGSETIAIYLWNPDMTPFSIRNGKGYLYTVERDY